MLLLKKKSDHSIVAQSETDQTFMDTIAFDTNLTADTIDKDHYAVDTEDGDTANDGLMEFIKMCLVAKEKLKLTKTDSFTVMKLTEHMVH